MVAVIDGFRWALLDGQNEIYIQGSALSLCVALAFLWLGIGTFRNLERSFADLV